MKKILFVAISIFIISTIGYSKVQDIGEIVYDDRIFGETVECRLIGLSYFMTVLAAIEKQTTGKFSEKTTDSTVYVIFNTNKLLIQKGWYKSSSEIENLNSYYKANCKKIRMGDIINKKNSYKMKVFLDIFYNHMNNLNMLEY